MKYWGLSDGNVPGMVQHTLGHIWGQKYDLLNSNHLSLNRNGLFLNGNGNEMNLNGLSDITLN